MMKMSARIARGCVCGMAMFMVMLAAGAASAEDWVTLRVGKVWAGSYPSHRGVSEPMIVFWMNGVYYYSLLDGSDLSNQKASLVKLAYSNQKYLSVMPSGNLVGSWKEVSLVGAGDF